jgi:hypothetical protein
VISARPQNAGLRGVYAVWALLALDAIAMFVTYSRIPPADLYHVAGSGLRGGASRVIVYFCFPTALVAIPILAIAYDRLGGMKAAVTAWIGVALCATVVWPGVVDQSNLDAKWSNAFAAVGALISLGLTFAAARYGRRRQPRTTRAGDRARLALAALVVFLAAPYIAAELGFFLDGVPVLGSLFITGAIRPEPGDGLRHAVHHGHHHGMDGLILTLSALLLSRQLGAVARPWLRNVVGFYLTLLAVYALSNMFNDLWGEQIVKRGLSSWEVPDLLRPTLSAAWAVMIAIAVVLYAVLVRPGPRYRPASSSSIHSDIGT